MNLLIISNVNGYPWAGSETVWHRTAMLALSEGHNVTAIVHSDLMVSSQIAEFRCAGGKVKNWKALVIARFQSLKERIAPTFSQSFLNSFDAILVSLGSLPAMTYVPGLVNGLLRTRSPVVLLCQFNSDHLIISPNERKTVRYVLEKTSAVVFCSERNLIEARRQFAVDPPNAYVIQNPIRNMNEPSCPWPDELSGFFFASVARLEVAWKGQDLLLDVLSQSQWKQRRWKLRFYGEGPDRDYLERLVGFYDLSDRVTFEGHVKLMKQIWENNHCIVMPSHGEGSPLAALEAMMAGRPVVATDVGGNAEIISDGKTGFIAEAATLDSFSKAMERAWESRNRWREMGEVGHLLLSDRAVVDPAYDLLEICSLAAQNP
jgi:glycosyltransferase involved in cell wall biosynthesis